MAPEQSGSVPPGLKKRELVILGEIPMKAEFSTKRPPPLNAAVLPTTEMLFAVARMSENR